MNVDLLIKENKELSEEKQRYKEMWFATNNALAKYRDLEKQLGCPLEVIIKALTNGIYIKNIYDEMTNFKCRLTYKNEELGWYFNIINGYVMVKDYKKTWWLRETKEE